MVRATSNTVPAVSTAASASFNASGLSAVDSYFGIDAVSAAAAVAVAVADHHHQPQHATTTSRSIRHHAASGGNAGGMKDFLKSNLKRKRKDQAVDEDDLEDRHSSDDEDEEQGRTDISKSKKAPQTAAAAVALSNSSANLTTKEYRKNNKSKEKAPQTHVSNTTTRISRSDKEVEVEGDTKLAADVAITPPADDDGIAAAAAAAAARQEGGDTSAPNADNDYNKSSHHQTWGKKTKTRSRQKNIRKDHRVVKPSFTRDPTAPGYRPLTAETKKYILRRNKNRNAMAGADSSGSIIAQLNNPTNYSAM
jgi:hypothetical protein